MAGHSKWNNIKNKKGKEDAKRAKVFTKLGRYIMVAAKEGGADPDYNPALKAAIDKAKAENMPNDNIERAIKKGSGELGADNFEEIIYEGYGPAGIAVFVQCLTDNRNRTAPDVRHAFDKCGGNMGQSGCVTFMFDKKGMLAIERTDSIDEDELTMLAIDLGAEDFVAEDEGFEIITSVEDFNSVKDGLVAAGYEFAMAELTYIPQNTVELTNPDDIKNMEKLIDMLEDNDDVQEVYHNWEMPEEE
ncbi:DNA-binding regulatory protein, YebC/PmpR family [Tissierella praeacuta DSM 18095]|uniref:Probable transcriptional regulatory protein SAMN02745784_00530 n=1 Tax=Tissierella praeacuta DSM 18095 TaxID=1123404 RepID=A0A1M4SWG0_9FIRM|nr:YebC/PmpR family DNA-binding transcriptional regulator [Tissierella praeacuta]TCU70729.1 YebC/PmpR family DNA-binding regulatory protein [Tissierella praeacuta]SHE36509.1 DNA-binding regulatory protein, YebC/PmpR family [Tissierella praeacuta DSM 18095]SUP01831.1 Probable transcriptional regulatory protein HI_0315 [Tissierella praeacuta]